VQAGPARLIARRAVRADWDSARTLAVFDAHALDAKRAGVKSPVAVAVARMVKNEQISPPPPEALARVRWLSQATGEEPWQGEERDNAGTGINAGRGWGEDDRGGEEAGGTT
jgi:hypothetical protein